MILEIAYIILTLAFVVSYLHLTRRYLPNLMQDVLNSVGADLGENIKKIMKDTVVKRGFSLMSEKGVDARNIKAAENNFSTAIIDKQIGIYKPLIKQVLNIDIDAAIEDYGAPAVLQLIQKFRPTIQNMLQGKGNKGKGALP